MSRVFNAEGNAVPVTVLEVSPNRVTQVKTDANDGYRAVQVTIGARRPSRVTKPLAGHFAKANVTAGRGLWEFRLDQGEGESLAAGAEIKADVFAVGQMVDVQGTTIGKGFAGVIKRHHFSSNRETHGNSITTRTQGSTGQRQDPGRVFPGKRMAGHLGNVKRTTQNLVVVRIDADRQLLLVKGSVPGFSGRDIIVRPAVKGQKAVVAQKAGAKAPAQPAKA
jgi:large subunit ribosomal protein L3